MPTSGAAPFFPRVSDVLDDALELGADIDPAAASERQLSSALRSFNRYLLEMDLEGSVISRTIQKDTQVVANQPSFFLEPEVLSVESVVIRENGTDIPMTQTSFLDWQFRAAKYQTGKPFNYVMHYGRPRDLLLNIEDASGTSVQPAGGYGVGPYGLSGLDTSYQEQANYNPDEAGPQVVLWPVPDKQYELVYTVIRQSQEACTLGENPDLRRTWTNAAIFYVAKDLSMKYKMEKYPILKAEYNEALEKARRENSTGGDFVIGAVGFDISSRRPGGRRRRR